MTAKNVSLEALIRETHDRSASLLSLAFDNIDPEHLKAMLTEVAKESAAVAPPCFMPDAISEAQMEDDDLLELLGSRIRASAKTGFDLGALEVEIRADLEMALENHLDIPRNTSFELS